MKWLMMKGAIIKQLQPLNSIFACPLTTVEISSNGVKSLVKIVNSPANQMPESIEEREQCQELKNPLNVLAPEVEPGNTKKVSNQTILNNAVYQKIIPLKMSKMAVELTRKRSCFNDQMKAIFADILDHEEKKKALELCEDITCYKHKQMNNLDEYVKAMEVLELEHIEELKRKPIHFLPWSFSNMRKRKRKSVKEPVRRSSQASDSNSWLGAETSNASSNGSSNSDPSQAPKSIQSEPAQLKRSQQPEPVSAAIGHQPTKRVLVRRRKPANPSDVIVVADSDQEGRDNIIEIESEEEDIVWLPNNSPPDPDVEITFSNMKNRRRRLRFPKPKRRLLPVCPDRHLATSGDLGTTPTTVEETVISFPLVRPFDPLSDDNSDSAESEKARERHAAVAQSVAKVWPSQTESVAVGEDVYDPVSSAGGLPDAVSGYSRTDTTPPNILERINNINEQFLPISASKRVNVRHIASASTLIDSLKGSSKVLKSTSKKLMFLHRKGFQLLTTPATSVLKQNVEKPPVEKAKVLECRKIIPIGKINPDNKYCSIKGKPTVQSVPSTSSVLSGPNISISSAPIGPKISTSSVLVTPTISTNSMLSGPKIRRPRGRTASNIKVLLPKRN